jgi:hypothetical protein
MLQHKPIFVLSYPPSCIMSVGWFTHSHLVALPFDVMLIDQLQTWNMSDSSSPLAAGCMAK